MDVEVFVFAVVLVAGLLPLVLRGGGSASRARLAVGATSAVLVAAVAGDVARRVAWAPGAVEARAALRPLEVRDEGYVSSRTCRGCHPREYATWHASYHRTMTQVARPEIALAPADGRRLESHGRSYRMLRRGDGLWLEMDDPAGTGRIERPVVLTTGSHHQQYYWVATGSGRNLEILPFGYLIGEERWIPRDAAFLMPPSETQLAYSGLWSVVCSRCHATHGRPRKDALGRMDTRVAELGIACEACHGPAARHVALNRDPRRRYREHWSGDGDPSIVQPERLSHERASEVCGQCHGVSLLDTAAQRDRNENGFRYRPGDVLDASRFVVKPAAEPLRAARVREELPRYLESHFWPDGMVRVSGREYNGLIESPCFQRGELSCLSCHEMHPSADDRRPLAEWADDQLAPGMDTDAACLGCHPELGGAGIERHTHHPSESSGSRCTNCHMPYTTYGLLKAIRSHEIDVPRVVDGLETDRPNACNLCHLDRTLAWTAEWMDAWYGQPPPALAADERAIAASVLWLLRGDAGQRVLAAWSMGWEPAREASGRAWMAPFLAQLLEDPYDAVRFVAARSLRSLPGAGAPGYDFLAAPGARAAAHERVLAGWTHPRGAARPALLLDAQGRLDRATFVRLVGERDERPVNLSE
jgi:hypothetical protein